MKKKSVVILVCTLMILTNISFFVTAHKNIQDSEEIQFMPFMNSEEIEMYPISEEITIVQNSIFLNNPPYIPSQPSGPTTVIVDNWYLYSTVTTDPDGDYISYGWDAGDGNVNCWTLFYPSGVTCKIYIRFLSVGTYTLQVKAKDQYGAESNFSQPLFVTAMSSTSNNPPYIPSNADPSNGETNVDINSDLHWTGGDPDPGDSVTFDVYFGSSIPLTKAVSNTSINAYNPGTLVKGLTYYWSIVSWDNHGASSQGPMWHFTTIEDLNTPPSKPTVVGPSTGQVGRSYTYSTTTIDLDSDTLYYLFDWDDGTDSEWVGPFNSGDICQESHIWNTRGSYAVKVKAKDVNGAESVWSDSLPISMPKTHRTNSLIGLMQIIIERFSFF